MRLVYLHQYFKFPTEQGGTRSYDLAKQFVEAGHSVSVLTTTSDKNVAKGSRWSSIKQDGIDVYYINIPYENGMSYSKRIYAFLRFVFYSTFKLLSMRCDVVLATSTPLTIGVPALIKKLLTKTPYVFEVRDVWPEAVVAVGALNNRLIQGILFWFERLFYRWADSIVPLSADMKESIVTRVPEVASRIHHVIPNIAEVGRFNGSIARVDLDEKLGFKPRFSILYAGTFGRVNGLHKVVELAAITLNIDPGICFILIGDGVLKGEIIDLSQKVGVLNKNLFIFDPVAKEELPRWYASVSMGSSFVIGVKELWANSANKFFDALAAGKPVLINYEGWQAEVIHSRNVGYVLPVEVTELSAREFVCYTQDTGLHNEQCLNSLRLAENEYSLEIASRNYLQVLSKAASRSEFSTR